MDHVDPSSEVDREPEVRSGDLPRVAVPEPVVRLLELEAVLYLLSEDSVVVSDSITEGGDLQSGHGVKETCSESAEASVSETCIGLHVRKLLIGVTQVLEGLAYLVVESHVGDVVGHGTAHEEFQGQIVDALCLCGLLRLSGDVPLVDDPVADRVGQGVVASLHGCMECIRILSVFQMLREIALDCGCRI